MNTHEPAAPDDERGEPWQYSLRGLLVFMTLVSICLAIGIHFAGFLFALLVFFLLEAAMLLSADWLIRPGRRRALAFLVAACWIVAGCGFAMLGVSTFVALILVGGVLPVEGVGGIWLSSMIGIVATSFGLCCYAMAIKRWRQITDSAQRT